MHLHSTHTPLLQHLWLDPHLKSNWRSVVEFFAETVVFRPLTISTEELSLMVDCLRRFTPLELHKGILNSFCLLILLIHTKHKHNKMQTWTDATFSFPSRRTHQLGRQGQKRVTNSQVATLKS